MADWKQIEEDFNKEHRLDFPSGTITSIVNWFKSRLESEYPSIEKLSEEDKNEFYRTDVTADIKVRYEN